MLVQSCTGPGQSGLSYRAAGWKCCPKRTSVRRSGLRRAVWLKPLVEGWQPVLCGEPARVLGWSGSIYSSGGWAAREYGRSPHPGSRVRRRIAQMGAAWVHRLGEHLPSIFPGRAEQTAAYRLLSDDAVTMDHILDSHFEQTVERCRAERLVLAVQDTTTLNYYGLSSTSGLDALGGGGKGSAGILAHFGVAVNAVGRPPGMYTVDTDFRQAEDKDSVRPVAGLERAQELARACPDSRVVTVCDREGDFRELISRAEQTGAALLVRASRGAQRRVALASGEDANLWDHVLETGPVVGRTIEVPACGGPNRRRGRTAKLTLRCTAVDLLAPEGPGEGTTGPHDRRLGPGGRPAPSPGTAGSEETETEPTAALVAADHRGPGRPRHRLHRAALVRTALKDRALLPCAEGPHPHRGPPPRRGR